jgi:hypothetical protein
MESETAFGAAFFGGSVNVRGHSLALAGGDSANPAGFRNQKRSDTSGSFD